MANIAKHASNYTRNVQVIEGVECVVAAVSSIAEGSMTADEFKAAFGNGFEFMKEWARNRFPLVTNGMLRPCIGAHFADAEDPVYSLQFPVDGSFVESLGEGMGVLALTWGASEDPEKLSVEVLPFAGATPKPDDPAEPTSQKPEIVEIISSGFRGNPDTVIDPSNSASALSWIWPVGFMVIFSDGTIKQVTRSTISEIPAVPSESSIVILQINGDSYSLRTVGIADGTDVELADNEWIVLFNNGGLSFGGPLAKYFALENNCVLEEVSAVVTLRDTGGITGFNIIFNALKFRQLVTGEVFQYRYASSMAVLSTTHLFIDGRTGRVTTSSNPPSGRTPYDLYLGRVVNKNGKLIFGAGPLVAYNYYLFGLDAAAAASADTVPSYIMTCADKTFKQGQTYALSVLRDVAASRQTQIEVEVSGGTVSPAFLVDEGEMQPFENQHVEVTPTAATCTVTLKATVGGKTYSVGKFTMSNVALQ